MRFLIDGNNLLHAYAEIVGPAIGREPLCRVLGQWALRASAEAVVVFDGPPPPPGVRQQMQLDRLDVRFSGPRSADDLIEEVIEHAPSPASLCVVTSDRALAAAGRHRRCRWVKAQDFVAMLSAPPDTDRPAEAPPPEKPPAPGPQETDDWLRRFGMMPDEPPDDAGQAT